MSVQSLSLNLPRPLYSRLEALARSANRTVETETIELLAAAVPDASEPAAVAASLAVLDEQSLWQAARSRLAADAAERIDGLHQKQQRDGLTDTEVQSLAELMAQYDRALLIRSQAAALLHERGHDVTEQ